MYMETNKAPTEPMVVRPSLISKPDLSPLAKADVDDARILSSISTGALVGSSKAGKSSSSPLKILSMLGLTALLAFFGYRYLTPSQSGIEIAKAKPQTVAAISSSAEGAVTAVTPAAAPETTNQAVPAASAAPTPAIEAAQIINEPREPAAQAKEAAAPEASPKQATSKTLAEKPLKEKVTKETKAEKADKAEKIAKAEKSDKAAKKSTQAESVFIAANPQTPVPATEKDVNLLAAMIAHGNGSTLSPPLNSPQRQTVATRGNPTIALAADAPSSFSPPNGSTMATATDKTGKPRNTDVVIKQPPETTESLLRRCGTLGFFEREFCRMRICTGQWDSDLACKTNLANGGVTPAASTVATDAAKR